MGMRLSDITGVVTYQYGPLQLAGIDELIPGPDQIWILLCSPCHGP